MTTVLNRDYFETQLGKLNGVLAFSGLGLGEDGKLRDVRAASTLTEAEAMASCSAKGSHRTTVHGDV